MTNTSITGSLPFALTCLRNTSCHELLIASQDEAQSSGRFNHYTGAIVHRLLNQEVGGAEFLRNFMGHAGLIHWKAYLRSLALLRRKKKDVIPMRQGHFRKVG